MPYTTLVAGTTILASWANACVRDQTVTPFANAAARTSAIATPVAGMVSVLTTAPITLDVHNGSTWISYLYPTDNTVGASETTASAAYVALATAGPAVTVTTGPKALVTIQCLASNSGANPSLMAFAVSGATTIAASDTTSVRVAGTNTVKTSSTFVVALTAGSNTFTCLYRTPGGTATYVDRSIIVQPLP